MPAPLSQAVLLRRLLLPPAVVLLLMLLAPGVAYWYRSSRSGSSRPWGGLPFASGVADDPIPPPRTDPSYEGRPASSWVHSLGDLDRDTRLYAARALVLMGNEAVPHVEAVYRHGTLLDRSTAATVLVMLARDFRSEAALASLLRAARSPDTFTRTIAMTHLGQTRQPAAIAALQQAAKDPNPRVAAAATRAWTETQTGR